MANTFYLLFFFFFIMLIFLPASKAVAPPPSSRRGCTDQLILFSPCLSYVASSPNNLTETASTKCCDVFSSSFAPNSLCFCYLLREDQILGFPLNSTRLLSLSSLCLSPPPTASSLNFLCAESPALPPLAAADILGIPVNNTSGTGSVSGGGGGKTVPSNNNRGAGTTLYFPSLNGSTSKFTGSVYYKSCLLSQLLTIFFVTLPLLNINILYF